MTSYENLQNHHIEIKLCHGNVYEARLQTKYVFSVMTLMRRVVTVAVIMSIKVLG
jgi:hypothetical protein